MRILSQLRHVLLTMAALVVLASVTFAASTGASALAAASDRGSVLVYNFYTSHPTNPSAENTAIRVTNHHPSLGIVVPIFFIADNGTLADTVVYLSPNQTACFLVSDLDPGFKGHIVMVASSTGGTGCPISFNYLSGSEDIKLATGHVANNVSAVAFQALYGPDGTTLPGCNESSFLATLALDGVSYSRAPRRLALDNILSPADGNSTLLVVNRIDGSLAIGSPTIGPFSGSLFDDAAPPNSRPFSSTASGNQFRSLLSDSFPNTAPPLSAVIPSGRTGRLELEADSGVGILGMAINFNQNNSTLNQAANLRAVELAPASSVVLPVFPLSDISSYAIACTPTGTNVTTQVTLPAQSTGIAINFANVAVPGNTFASLFDPSSAWPLPPNYTLSGSNLAFNISTSAAVSGPITVCFTAPSVSDAEFANLRILHGEGGTLVDRTILPPDSPAPNPATKTICARTNSLSPFVLALVTDTTPPTITGVSANPSVLWPPNHRMVNVTVGYNVTDDVTPSSEIACRLSVSSNEPIKGTDDGDTAPDWQIVNAHRVRLRAERAGNGNGRIYTITITCTDAVRNSSSQTVTVSVPKSRQ